jgi:catechol 2,3-dioxygenase-like lactoylglutathione lyase family enzyme
MPPFKIDFLDHVAIRVKNLEKSARWYTDVLGLKRYELPEWGPFPIFLLAGQTGLALFPESTDAAHPEATRVLSADHFAFRVNKTEYEKAKAYYLDQNIPFKEQNHHYFYSIYLSDPDGYKVELTTLVGKESLFESPD